MGTHVHVNQQRLIPHLADVRMFLACGEQPVSALTVLVGEFVGLMTVFSACVCFEKRPFFDDRFLGIIFFSRGEARLYASATCELRQVADGTNEEEAPRPD